MFVKGGEEEEEEESESGETKVGHLASLFYQMLNQVGPMFTRY